LGAGAHNPQEDHPQAIGRHIAEWIAEIQRTAPDALMGART
jgi:hypothetical protein